MSTGPPQVLNRSLIAFQRRRGTGNISNMSNPDAGPSNRGGTPSRPRSPNPIDRLHPVLLRLIERMLDLPEGYEASLTERQLTRAVECAISMMPEDEQAYLVSHIMTDEELMQQRINSLELENLERSVLLSAAEKQYLLRATPVPEESDADRESNSDDYTGYGACKICYLEAHYTLSCGCHYCTSCLRWTIRTGLRSLSEFPPRCCFDLGEGLIRVVNRPGLIHLFRQLSVEHGVPLHQRLYCCDTKCSAFIPPSAIKAASNYEGGDAGVGTCPQCSKETCVNCRDRSHRGQPCGKKEKETAVMDMMDQQGLVYCPGCGMIVTADGGCNILR